MSDTPSFGPQEQAEAERMMAAQEFAVNALEELSKRAEADGHDLNLLHSAIVVAAAGFLVNRNGPDMTFRFLEEIAQAVAHTPAEEGGAPS